MKDKFKTKNGTLTRYAFACGYIERIDINDNNRGHICLEPNGYHVKGFQNGCHFWDIFNRVSDARKRLNQLKGFKPCQPLSTIQCQATLLKTLGMDA